MNGAPWAGRKLHFIGVGGAGMSGLALLAHELGAEVTGSEVVDTPYSAQLRSAGIEPSMDQDAAAVPERAEVVISTAIPADNPELAAAREAGASVLHRADLLGEVSRLGRCIAVAGTHGKTTTAAMIAHALTVCGRDPAFYLGAKLSDSAVSAGWGDGGWVVVETDESDRSFLKLARDVAVVTNIELDHHSTYHSLAELTAAFDEFAEPASVRVVGAEQHRPPGPGETVAFGIGAGELSAESVELPASGARFEVAGVQVELGVPGRHNVLNALAALAACRAAGLEPAEAGPTLASFHGTARRFEDRGRTAAGARVFDDYAHHPTEVRASLETALALGGKRLIVCFQPHLYSRTRLLAREFGEALSVADVVLVMDIFPSRERARDHPGVTGWIAAAAAADAAGGRPVYWTPRFDDAERLLAEELGEGDVLVTVGAGDVDRLADRLTATSATPNGAS